MPGAPCAERNVRMMSVPLPSGRPMSLTSRSKRSCAIAERAPPTVVAVVTAWPQRRRRRASSSRESGGSSTTRIDRGCDAPSDMLQLSFVRWVVPERATIARGNQIATAGRSGFWTLFCSGDDGIDELAVDVGQAHVAAAPPERLALVIDAEQVEHGGVEVVDLALALNDLVTVL